MTRAGTRDRSHRKRYAETNAKKARAIDMARSGEYHRAQPWSHKPGDKGSQKGHKHAGVTDLCAAMGIAPQTYRNWRLQDKDFCAKFDHAWELAMPQNHATYDGTFASFRRVYLGMQTTWFQARIIEEILAAQPGEVVLILIPPAHGKTTLLEDFCTWKLAEDPTYRVTVGSETVDHGEKIVSRVRDRLEAEGHYPLIHREFGPFAPEKGDKSQVWSQRRFNVARKLATSGERDYSMNCVGLTGRVQGTRCDLLLLDDMQDVKSLELSKKYFDIVTQSFLSRPEMFGRTVIIGTRVGRDDVYQRLMQANIPDRIVTFPAYSLTESVEWPPPTKKPVLNKKETWAPEGVDFLWPEKYDDTTGFDNPFLEGLSRFRYAKLRYQLGEQTWWRIYMQAPEVADNMTFDDQTIEALKDGTRSVLGFPRPIRTTDLSHGEINVQAPVPVLIGVDPSIGGGNGIVSAAGYPNRLDILNCRLDYSLTKYSQIIDLIEEECRHWSTVDSVVTALIVEDKAFQKGLLRDERLEEVQRQFGFRIVPNTTNREKADPNIGVRGMPLSMLRQEITMPWADNRSVEVMTPLVSQLTMWRPNTTGAARSATRHGSLKDIPQDLVMALWFVWRYWRTACQETGVHAPQGIVSHDFRGAPSPLRRRPRPTTRRRPYSTMRGGRRWP